MADNSRFGVKVASEDTSRIPAALPGTMHGIEWLIIKVGLSSIWIVLSSHVRQESLVEWSKVWFDDSGANKPKEKDS